MKKPSRQIIIGKKILYIITTYFSVFGIFLIIIYLCFLWFSLNGLKAHCSGVDLCGIGAVLPLAPILIISSILSLIHLPLFDLNQIISAIIWLIILYCIGLWFEKLIKKHSRTKKDSFALVSISIFLFLMTIFMLITLKLLIN